MTMSTRQLVITADDMGYSRERDEGIIHCYKAGVITRASLMVNGASSQTAAAMALEASLPIGLHLNMTEGLSISKKEDIPSLLKNGYFHDMRSLPRVLADGGINMTEVVVEMTAQIKKFESLTGHLPPYIDGHQHVHTLPGVAEVFASTLSTFGVTWTRLPVEDTDHSPWVEDLSMPFFIKTSNDAELAAKAYTWNHVRFTDSYFGMMTMGKHLSVDRIQDALSRIYSLHDNTDDVTTTTSSHTDDVNTSISSHTDDVTTTTSSHTDDVTTTTSIHTDDVTTTTSTHTDDVTTTTSTHTDDVNTTASTHTDDVNTTASTHTDDVNATTSTHTDDVTTTTSSHTDDVTTTISSHTDDVTTSIFSHTDDVNATTSTHTDDVTTTASSHTDDVTTTAHTDEVIRSCELMVHPGYVCTGCVGGCGEGPDDFAQSQDREHEMAVLQDKRLTEFYEKHNIKLVPFPI